MEILVTCQIHRYIHNIYIWQFLYVSNKSSFCPFQVYWGLFSRIRCLSGLIAYLAWRGMRRHNNYRGMRVFTHRAHVEGLCGGWHTQLTVPTMIHLSHRVTIVTYLVVTDEKDKIFVLPFFALEKYRNWWESKEGRSERISIFLILLDIGWKCLWTWNIDNVYVFNDCP